jgi:hypothetical protein
MIISSIKLWKRVEKKVLGSRQQNREGHKEKERVKKINLPAS